MKRRRGRLGWAAGLVLLLVPLAAAAPKAAPSDEALRAKREALGEVRRQLEGARARASAAREREVSLLAELEQIDRTVARKREELARLDPRIARLEVELDRLDGRRGRVAEDTVAQRTALASRLKALARLAAEPAGAPDWSGEVALLARMRAAGDLGRIARLDLERLSRFDETAGELRERQAAIARGRRELVELRRAGETERAALAEQGERRRRLLAGVREDRATHERMAAELEEATRRLEALVRELARRRPARVAVARPVSPGGPPPPAVGLGALRGQLPWPAEGRIVEGFGRQVHPRFGTETVRHGVDIEADAGAPIRAVHPGTVAYRGSLRGYGNLVIVDHGQGYYTLYGHASEVTVGEGDVVKAGQAIARVGDTGSVEGPRLYFEVRYQGRAEDPQVWLRRRP